MFKRGFYVLAGLGAGVTVGIWAVRKLERTSAKLRPQHLGGVAVARAAGLRERLTVALDEGRRAAGEKESEMRLHYRGGEAPPSREAAERRAAPPSPAATQGRAAAHEPVMQDDPSLPDAH